MRRDAILFHRHDPHLASSTAAIIGHRTHISGTRSMPTARRGKGVGPASLSRGGRRASGASPSRTRRSSRLHVGDDVVASEKSVDEETMEEVSAGNALLALSRRSRPKETGPATQAPPEPSIGAAPPRPRRRSAPPPGRWSPASKKSATRSNETKSTKPGAGAPRRLVEQPQAVESGSPMRRESETTGSSSRAGQTTPPAAHHSETSARLPKRAEKSGATSTCASTSTVRRSPRRKEPQPESALEGRPPKAPRAKSGAVPATRPKKSNVGARSAARSATSKPAGRRGSTAAKTGVKPSAWEKKYGPPDPEFQWHEKERLAVLRAIQTCEERDCLFGFENMGFKQINDHGWGMWQKHILTDVVASLSNDSGYPFPPEELQKKFFDPRNFIKIKKWVDDQKSQLRKEKQLKNQTGAPAKSRAKPTELQAMRDAALGGSRQMTYGINTIETARGDTTPPPARSTESQEHSDSDPQASLGGAAAAPGASVDLSSTPDNAETDGRGRDGRGRKGKGRARDIPPAGVVGIGGGGSDGSSSEPEVGGAQEEHETSEESDDEESVLSDTVAEAGFSQSSPGPTPGSPSENTRAKRERTPQRDRGRKKKKKKTKDFDSKSVGDFLAAGQQRSAEQNSSQLKEIRGIATGIEGAIDSLNSRGGGGGSGESAAMAERKLRCEEAKVNMDRLQMMIMMKEKGIGIAPTNEEIAAAYAATKL